MFPLISVWTVRQGHEKAAIAVLKRVAAQVQAEEKDTLAYLIHVPDMSQPSLPTPSRFEVVFFEIYRNKAAFEKHVTGPVFQNFVKRHKRLFLCMQVAGPDGKKIDWPYSTVEFLTRQAGFIRPEAIAARRNQSDN
ncbi:MAG TPA: antibiotic biosynthesis monooxygenase [Chthoniobacterales bacterium]|nr:antibiotic biosynthesis monooxygenase [Chthoniobacterales bacterium]